MRAPKQRRSQIVQCDEGNAEGEKGAEEHRQRTSNATITPMSLGATSADTRVPIYRFCLVRQLLPYLDGQTLGTCAEELHPSNALILPSAGSKTVRYQRELTATHAPKVADNAALCT